MRLSVVILPVHPWSEARERWVRAEELGFDAAYTYDHLAWRSLRDRPWFGAIPTLTAAASATTRLQLGPLVSSPNFRHPVTLAKELMTLDDISCGRVLAGLGAGGVGYDASTLGQPTLTASERSERFTEFVDTLDELLTNPTVTRSGAYFQAVEARSIPGCVQQPRIPFLVAAAGPKATALAVRRGQGWVTFGDPSSIEESPDCAKRTLGRQLAQLHAQCELAGRDPATINKILLTGLSAVRPLASLDAFVDFAGRHLELGFDELIVHWPLADSPFEADMGVFEAVALAARAQLAS